MIKSILFLLVATITLFSCKDDDPESPLKGCCGNEAINEDVGNGHIYVPNIFTPNDDGINDLLYIATDSIQTIVEVEIRDKNGTIVFETFDPMVNSSSDAWDGEIDGAIVQGLYTISVSVLAENGTSRTIEGKVCNFPCDGDNVTEQVSGENCQFPSQVDSGYFCPTCPSGEGDDCYK